MTNAAANSPKPLTLRYFALLREEAGLAEEQVHTAVRTPAELYAELAARHGFTLPPARMAVAINDAFQPMDAPLAAGDRVTFIPPVAGG